AASIALAVGELMAVMVAEESAPLVAVGGVIIDRVPQSGKDLAIRLFGTNDKMGLQIGTIVVLLGLAALLRVAGPVPLWGGPARLGAFTIIGSVAAQTRTGASVVWFLPSLGGGVAAGFVLWLLLRLAQRATGGDRAQLGYLGQQRRRFLTVAAATVVGSAV